jgi:predicted transcriptional regulator
MEIASLTSNGIISKGMKENMAQEYGIMAQEKEQMGSVSAKQANQLNRRSRLETYGDILYAVSIGAEKPTHIMYKANLSWVVMKEYLKSLESYGLITCEEVNGNRIYHLSPPGFKVLQQFLDVKDELKLSSE